MKRRSYAKALDEALRPFGFERQGDDWIRVRGDMWECVNRQSGWLGGVTVNFDMKDLETERLFLSIFAARGAIQMPTIGARIGELIDGYDRWWKKDEPNGPAEMAQAVVDRGVTLVRSRALIRRASGQLVWPRRSAHVAWLRRALVGRTRVDALPHGRT